MRVLKWYFLPELCAGAMAFVSNGRLNCAFKHTVNIRLINITQKCIICSKCQLNRASTVSLGPTTANKRERNVLEQMTTMRTPDSVMFTCILTPSVVGYVLCSSLLLPPFYTNTLKSKCSSCTHILSMCPFIFDAWDSKGCTCIWLWHRFSLPQQPDNIHD